MDDTRPNRRVRNTKTVDYAALCNSDDSDDDFVTNKKQQSKVANPTRLPRVSKLKLPVKAVESPNEKKVEKENNFTKLRTPPSAPQANKTPLKVAPVKEMLDVTNNPTNQTTTVRQKIPVNSEPTFIDDLIPRKTITNNEQRPVIDEIDSFYGPEPDLVTHSVFSQDTDIISSCECTSSSQESDDGSGAGPAAPEPSTFVMGPSPVIISPIKTGPSPVKTPKKAKIIVLSSDSDSEFDRPIAKKPMRGNNDRPKRRVITDDDYDPETEIKNVSKAVVEKIKPVEVAVVPVAAVAKKVHSPEQMTKKDSKKENRAATKKTPPTTKPKAAKTKGKKAVESPKVEEKIIVETIKPDEAAEDIEPPKAKKLKVDEEMNKKKTEDELKMMKPPLGRANQARFKKVIPNKNVPVATQSPAVPVAKPVTVMEPPIKPATPATPKLVVKPKQPAWNPPGRSDGVSTPKATNSPVTGLRLGLSRNRRVKPLHPDAKIKT